MDEQDYFDYEELYLFGPESEEESSDDDLNDEDSEDESDDDFEDLEDDTDSKDDDE